MEHYEKYFVIGLVVTFILALFSPWMVLSPNDGATTSYVFLFKVQLLKTMIIVLGGLGLTIAWHLSKRVKTYIIEYIGFEKNMYLLSCLLLLMVTGSVMSLGEMNNLLTDYTTMLRMHMMYYVIQILLIALVAYAIYLLLHQAQGGFRGHVMGYSPKNRPQDQDDMQGLFENLKD